MTDLTIKNAEKGASLWNDAWVRLKKNKLAYWSMFVILALIVLSILTPWIAPYGYE